MLNCVNVKYVTYVLLPNMLYLDSLQFLPFHCGFMFVGYGVICNNVFNILTHFNLYHEWTGFHYITCHL